MWVKLIGGGMMVLSALAYCYQYERRARQTQQKMAAWVTLLTYIRTQIACFATPLSEILLHADARVLAVLEEGEPLTATMLASHCQAQKEQFPKEFGTLLERLAQELGTVWRQEQIARLDYYIEALTQQREAFFESSKGATRTRRTLILCGVLGVILLVW